MDFSIVKNRCIEEKLKKIYKEEQKLNNREPMARPKRDPGRIRATGAFQQNPAEPDGDKMIHVFITGKCHCSTKQFSQLQPIMLSQMEVPKIHYGRSLLCRVVAASAGNDCFIEDTNGDVERLEICHLDPNKWLKVGTILLIKEPQMLMKRTKSDDAYIRVDSPSDVLFLHESQRDLLQMGNAVCWYKSETCPAEVLKAIGNQMFQQGDSEAALGFYKRALAANPSTDLAAIIHLNMAAVLLQLGHFYEAYAEAELALRGKNISREKALHRLAMASYGMRDWAKAEKWQKQLLAEFPNSKDGVDMAKVEARQKEAATGQYDMMAILKLVKTGQTDMDLADYVGPVKVVDIPGKGKGLVTTKDVPKGTLLAATKAYVFYSNYGLEMVHGLNMITDELNSGSQVCCISDTIRKLKRNPQTAKQLYALYAGPNMDRGENIPEGVIDTGRIEKIITYNAHMGKKVETFDEDVVEILGSGLWLLPSFANHSCLATGTHVEFGDMQFIFANNDLKAGEEITLLQHNLSPLKLYKEREQYLKKFHIRCQCRLCELDRAEPEEERQREAILKRYKKILPKILIDPHKQRYLKPMEQLVKEMRRTYRARTAGFHTHLCNLLSMLGGIHYFMRDAQKAIPILEEVPVIFADLNIHSVDIHMGMAVYLRGFQPPKIAEARRAIEKAFETAKLFCGVTDWDMMKLMYPECPNLI